MNSRLAALEANATLVRHFLPTLITGLLQVPEYMREPSITAAQIDRLVSLSRQSNIRIGVLPLSAQVRDGAYHNFVTYDRRLVTIKLLRAN